MSVPKKVALIIGSTRTPRLGPFVATHVHNIIKPLAAAAGVTIDVIDVADQGLPFYSEPVHPAGMPKENPTPHYGNDYSRNWSALISQYQGFAYVTPEYNRSMPAALKNAIDYLFHEWSDKPAGIVSYGGRQGRSSAGHLRDVLASLNMTIVPTSAGFKTSRQTLPHCLETGAPRPEDLEVWKEAGSDKEVEDMFAELVQELNKPKA